jgi:hypothetical protein
MISIKPHHFVDIITSFGAGKRTFKAHSYGHAVHTVSEQILNHRDICLEMELGIDDICKPCVHNAGGVCNDTIDTSYRPLAPPLKNDSNLLIDRRWCRRLGIAQGTRLTARKFCELIRDNMGDITDIYQEIPVHMTAERKANLVKGLEYYLNT